mmetsp:Transcript_120488/g.341416  ORF Transcript_120488/g.341416 Transcript_120488/m.341416 type:complete len:240 (+) Transcript_120488:541-1260(+)
MSTAKRLQTVITPLLRPPRTMLSNHPRENPQYMTFSWVRPRPISPVVRSRSRTRWLTPNPAAEPSGFWSSICSPSSGFTWVSAEARNASAYAPSHVPTFAGIAFCMCVYPGRGTSLYFSAAARNTAASCSVCRRISCTWCLANKRIMVRDWSFRLLPVWIFFPTSPNVAVRCFSIAVWQSSSSREISNFPAECSPSISSSPAASCRPSSAVSTPILASIFACALEATRSNLMKCAASTR